MTERVEQSSRPHWREGGVPSDSVECPRAVFDATHLTGTDLTAKDHNLPCDPRGSYSAHGIRDRPIFGQMCGSATIVFIPRKIRHDRQRRIGRSVCFADPRSTNDDKWLFRRHP